MPHQASAEILFAEITTLTQSDTARDSPLAQWRDTEWRTVLSDLPLDGVTFAARFERTWDQHITELTEWCARFRDPSARQAVGHLYGYLGLLLLTLQSLRHSERYRSGSSPPSGHDCEHACRPLVRDPAVRDAIRRLYHPTTPDSELAEGEWENLDFATLEFHRHGTTSFIVTGKPRQARQGQLPTFALKCIIYPFLRMPTIGRASRGYAKVYDITDRDVRHLVHVWASDDRWILMDFVAGETLAELLDREHYTPTEQAGLPTNFGSTCSAASVESCSWPWRNWTAAGCGTVTCHRPTSSSPRATTRPSVRSS